ncbi:344_t:CDS:2, partial [Racocetra fulgida]
MLLAPTLITEIEVDDRAYPVEVLEIQESVFDMKAPLRWPKADCDPTKRQVDTEYGVKLAPLFDVGFVELDTRSNNGIQRIHNVFSMLLKLSIRNREFIKGRHNSQEIKSDDLSSDFMCIQSIGSDVDSEKLSISSDDEGSSSTRSNHRSLSRSPFSSSPSVSATPSNTPPKSSVLSQVSLPSFPIISNKSSHSDRSSYRRSFLPSSTLLQVMEAEEEKDIVIVRTGHSRTSCGSYDSTASSVSAISDNSWEGLFVNDPLSHNKCTGRGDGLTIDELIQRLTVGGQYGTHDDPDMFWGFVDTTDEKLIKHDVEHKNMNSTIIPHAKKDSGFGGWTYFDSRDNLQFSRDNHQSDLSLSVQQANNRTSSQPLQKSSLIIVPDSSIGRPMSQLTFDELPEKAIANELTFQEFQLFKKIS